MKKTMVVPFLVRTMSALIMDEPVSYDGHVVFRIHDARGTQSLVDRLGVKVWHAPSETRTFADVQVAPGRVGAFEAAMRGEGFETEVLHGDLGQSIAREKIGCAGAANDSWFDSYHPYDDHVRWMHDLESRYASHVRVVTSGKSSAGSSIVGLQIFGSSGGDSKPAVVFHGTTHAREWIVAMTVEYIAYELITKYRFDNAVQAVVDKYDFYIFPIVNIDGFKYSQTKDRMWRKNRSPISESSCVGTDLNRNWPYHWDDQGSSSDPCSETYRGSFAGSATEIKSLSGFLDKIKKQQGVKLYIDWHSYSQLFMTPYGFSCSVRAANDGLLQSLASGAVDAIKKVHGSTFEYGPICSTIYQAVGGSVDWVKDILEGDYAFTIELRDIGQYGFVLPSDQIKPSGEEAFAGVMYLFQNMQ